MTLTHSPELSTLSFSVNTMSPDNFNFIDSYIKRFSVIGTTVEETERNIMNLESFKSGCFTYLQAKAFAEYYHSQI